MASKALLVGVNEYKKYPPLRGCIHDVADVEAVLLDQLAFDPRNVRTLLDERATGQELNKQLKWLYANTRPGDEVFFYFAGCGSYVADSEGNEPDARAQILCLHDLDFKDPATFLTHADLHRWINIRPEGVRVILILDLCHSGNGTRLVLSPATGEPIRLEVPSTLRRAAAQGQELTPELAASAIDPDGPDAVGTRFIEPPVAIQEKTRALAIKRASRTTANPRTAVGSDQVILTACGQNQTAVEAQFEDDHRGVFTYQLCKTMRVHGPGIDHRSLISLITQALADDQFNQAPRLEPQDLKGPLFQKPENGPAKPSHVLAPLTLRPIPSLIQDPAAGPTDAEAVAAVLHWISSPENGLPTRLKNRVADLMEAALHAPAQAPRLEPAQVPGRCLIYVPDIGAQTPGFSDRWWAALQPYTSAYGNGGPETRRVFLWNPLGTHDSTPPGNLSSRQEWMARVRGALEDRIGRNARNAGPNFCNPTLVSANAMTNSSENGLPHLAGDALMELAGYLFDDQLRILVLNGFQQVVEPLLKGGCQVDLIAHGCGSVIAYEGLRSLDPGTGSGRVRNFFTLGAALSLFPIGQRLLPQNQDGSRPTVVSRWLNLNAQGDPIGGQIQNHPFQVDVEYPTLCVPDAQEYQPGLAHQSYFNAQNTQVNQQILAHYLDRS